MTESSTSGGAASSSSDDRSPEQIQSEIDAAQERLADHVDELSGRLTPQALAGQAVDGAKRLFLDADGNPRAKPIALASGGVSALLVFRKLFHR